jgi:hypothetical protein
VPLSFGKRDVRLPEGAIGAWHAELNADLQ